MLLNILEFANQYVEEHNIHLLNILFIGFISVMVLFGSLMFLTEAYLPDSIKQSFRYGKHSHKGPATWFISALEVPKSWFKHFYVLAFALALGALCLVMKGFMMESEAPECILAFLDIMAGGRANREVQVDASCVLVAVVLMTMQCGRRFYESNFVQIFSKQSKMNISHYMVGYLHYFGTLTAILANAEGFVRGTVPTNFALSKITVLQYVCICLFHFSWLQQYNSNMILVNLRKDQKTGKVITEKHLMPKGGFFYVVSSPHMLFEILLYIALLGIMPNSISLRFVVFWVITNQVNNALLTHQWYKQTFPDYPKNRRALIPYLL